MQPISSLTHDGRAGHFQHRLFSIGAGRGGETNPGRIGDAQAHWTAEKLRLRGIEVEEVLPEDFGWIVMVHRKPVRLWLGCGNTEGSIDEWNVFPVAEVPLVRRLLGRAHTEESLKKLWEHVRQIVPLVPGVKNISWE